MAGAEPVFRWRDLRKRAVSAAILAPAVLLCIWLGAIPWTLLVAVAIAGMVYEWVRICGMRPHTMPGVAMPVAVFLSCGAAVLEQYAGALLALAAGFLLTWALAYALRNAPEPDRPRHPAGRLAVGVLMIGLAGIALIWLRSETESGRLNVLFLFLIVWASDIGAYLCGRLFGGPKLAPRISPSKTWSGSIGGLVSVSVVGGLIAPLLAPGVYWKAVLVAIVLGIATQVGDLLESAFKRKFDVKDSGSLIPGHGGLLDRLDGLLIAAPVAALLALIFGQGVLWQ